MSAATAHGASLSGTGFSLSSAALPATLSPSQAPALTVQFDAIATGDASDQLTIASNSSTNGTAVVSIGGTGRRTPAALSQLSCSSGSMTGAGTDACTVTLTAAASSGGLTVNLFSSSSAVTVPSTLTVPSGAISATFTATMASVATAQPVTITASAGSASAKFALQLNAAVPELSFSASSLPFGNVQINTSATQSVILTSNGTTAVTVNSVSLAGTGFSLSSAALPATLNPGQALTLTVQFDPTATGAASGQLAITSNSSTNVTTVVMLSGTGTTAAAALSQLSCSSGSMTGAGTDACTVTLTAAAPSGGLTVNLFSSNSAVTVPSTLTVPSGATSATFTATVASVTTAQAVTITASAGSASAKFALQLNAAVPELSFSASSLPFGNVQINTSATQSVILTSNGTTAVTVNSVSLAGTGFSLSSAALPATLSPGQALALTVQFDPTATGAASGQLAITSNSSTNVTTVVMLSGTGTTAAAALSLLSCSSGSMTGAGTDACTVTLTAAASSGGLSVNLSSSNSAVTVPSTVTIPSGAASASFTATVASVTTAQAVTITASVGSMFTSYTLQLNATIIALSINPASVAFGNVVVNTPTTQSITLTSTGTAPVTINGITLTGTGFTLSEPALPITLPPNQATTVDISFDPTAASATTGQLTISSNASTNGTAVVGLTGIGLAATAGATYYLAPAAAGGNDSNNGLSSQTPWLTPNHSVNCGDLLTAAAGTYPEGNFNATFGTVTGSGHCFAFLKCATFDACYVAATDGGAQFWVTKSHWAVMGFEAQNPNPTSSNSCFKASPLSAATITDVAFIDDIANGCPLGGFITAPYYVGGAYGVDYFTLIADIAYNAAQSNNECASGISVFEPVNSDTAPGTHIYIAQYFGWGNVDPSACAGAAATDGEGIILDTFSNFAYSGQTAVENAITLWNGSVGIEAWESAYAPIYVQQNTAFADASGPGLNNFFCGEIETTNPNTAPLNALFQATGNIARTNSATGCGSNQMYAYYAAYVQSSNVFSGNLGYSAAGNNTSCNGTCTGFSFGPNNIFGTDPVFANPPSSKPAAPSCGSYSSVPACAATLTANMKPTAAGMSNYGYQQPSSTPNSDPLFPQWLCQYSNQLEGLVTMGCAAQ